MFVMNADIAKRVLNVVDQGLSEGLGKPVPGQMCVEAAVCYALGLPHSDDPGCVANSVRALKIRLNDSSWSSNAARAKGMRRLAIAQLGTKGNLDEKEFATRVAIMTIKKIVSLALRNAALDVAADRCENEGSAEAARNAHAVARAALASGVALAPGTAASAAASAAADAAADIAANATDAAYVAIAACEAARAVDYAADCASFTNDKDSVFNLFAEEVVKILVDMKTPGSEYLYLTE